MKLSFFRSATGIYLFIISVILLTTVLRAVPDGVKVTVNTKLGAWETAIDIGVLVIGIVLGIWLCIREWRDYYIRNHGIKEVK